VNFSVKGRRKPYVIFEVFVAMEVYINGYPELLIYVAFCSNALMRRQDILSRRRNQPFGIKHDNIIQKKNCKFQCLYSYMQKMYVNYAMFIFIFDRLFYIWILSTVCHLINNTFQRGKLWGNTNSPAYCDRGILNYSAALSTSMFR